MGSEGANITTGLLRAVRSDAQDEFVFGCMQLQGPTLTVVASIFHLATKQTMVKLLDFGWIIALWILHLVDL